jgi:hypothetical protein
MLKILTLVALVTNLVACSSQAAYDCPDDKMDAGQPDALVYGACVAPAGGHMTMDVVGEPDGSYTCLPGACDTGWADCDGNPENGCEASLLSDDNCGVCGIVCGVGESCYNGSPLGSVPACLPTNQG